MLFNEIRKYNNEEIREETQVLKMKLEAGSNWK